MEEIPAGNANLNRIPSLRYLSPPIIPPKLIGLKLFRAKGNVFEKLEEEI